MNCIRTTYRNNHTTRVLIDELSDVIDIIVNSHPTIIFRIVIFNLGESVL
jgi:hypothetical protein